MFAKDGLKIIRISLIVVIALVVVWLITGHPLMLALFLLSVLLFLFNLYFFRDPQRRIPGNPRAVLSPADGKVIQIVEEVEPNYFSERVYRISIFLSVLNVHVNRVPISGMVNHVAYHPGKFFAAFKEKASLENEQTEIGIVGETGKRVMFKQIAGLIARRVVCNLHEGQKVKAGERMGMIRYGSRVDIFLPLTVKLLVSVGQNVFGGESILAMFEEQETEMSFESEFDEMPLLDTV